MSSIRVVFRMEAEDLSGLQATSELDSRGLVNDDVSNMLLAEVDYQGTSAQ